MKNRENTILVRKKWGQSESDFDQKKVKDHFEQYGKCQIYFGWLYTGDNGAEIEYENKEMQQKALDDATDFGGYNYEAAPEPPTKEEIDELKKKMDLDRKKYKAALHASKTSGNSSFTTILIRKYHRK